MERNIAKHNNYNSYNDNQNDNNTQSTQNNKEDIDSIKAVCSKRLEARRKAKLVRCRQIAAVKCFIVSLIMIIVVGVSGIFVVNASNKTNDTEYIRYYTSICVDSNDTLWSIAKEYHPDNCDITRYISDIRAINNMSSDTIYAGQNLIVYYYEFEENCKK